MKSLKIFLKDSNQRKTVFMQTFGKHAYDWKEPFEKFFEGRMRCLPPPQGHESILREAQTSSREVGFPWFCSLEVHQVGPALSYIGQYKC
jgi:hypothetical protein